MNKLFTLYDDKSLEIKARFYIAVLFSRLVGMNGTRGIGINQTPLANRLLQIGTLPKHWNASSTLLLLTDIT